MGIKQGTTIPILGTELGTGSRAKGSADHDALKKLYPDSPVMSQNGILADDDGYASELRKFYQESVIDPAQAGAMADSPDLANVTTPSDQPEGAGVIVSPYMPNVATDQSINGEDAVPTDRSGANGSTTSPSTDVGDYSLTAAGNLGTSKTTAKTQ